MAELSFDEVLKRSEEKEKGLELKATVSIDTFKQSALHFQILAEKGKENPDFWLKTIDATDKASTGDWEKINELGKNWLFRVYDYKVKKFLKNRNEFLKG